MRVGAYNEMNAEAPHAPDEARPVLDGARAYCLVVRACVACSDSRVASLSYPFPASAVNNNACLLMVVQRHAACVRVAVTSGVYVGNVVQRVRGDRVYIVYIASWIIVDIVRGCARTASQYS